MEKFPQRRVLYYCPLSKGGIADYTLAQTRALSELGTDVTLLTTASLAGAAPVAAIPDLIDETAPIPGPRWRRWIQRVQNTRHNVSCLHRHAVAAGYQHVLFATYCEYGAPMWVGELNAMARQGVRFSAILHDPIRDHVVGPAAFHRWSVQAGYSFLRDVFVHEEIPRSQTAAPDHVRITMIPHGPFDFPSKVDGAPNIRLRFGIPPEAKLVLAFGQVRDGKNLHLAIQALRKYPGIWLLVVGHEAGPSQRGFDDYQALAASTGVGERCRWHREYVPSTEVSGFFEAADLILLTYSARFRSASGVLNTAVQFRRPCLASSGRSPLRTQVERHSLGVWVEPDSQAAVEAGVDRWLRGEMGPARWSDYVEENSWRRNAELVLQQLWREER